MSAENSSVAYPRLTSLAFLDQCSPVVASFYRYWDAARHGRRMPRRADLDPIEMKPWLPGILLVDVVRAPVRRLTYRVVGSRSVEIRGMDVTGRTIEDGRHGPNFDAVLENYRLVTEDATLVYDFDRTVCGDTRKRYAEALMLPLSTDGETVDQVIVYIEIDVWNGVTWRRKKSGHLFINPTAESAGASLQPASLAPAIDMTADVGTTEIPSHFRGSWRAAIPSTAPATDRAAPALPSATAHRD